MDNPFLDKYSLHIIGFPLNFNSQALYSSKTNRYELIIKLFDHIINITYGYKITLHILFYFANA